MVDEVADREWLQVKACAGASALEMNALEEGGTGFRRVDAGRMVRERVGRCPIYSQWLETVAQDTQCVLYRMQWADECCEETISRRHHKDTTYTQARVLVG